MRLAETVYYLARGFDSFEGSMLERAGGVVGFDPPGVSVQTADDGLRRVAAAYPRRYPAGSAVQRRGDVCLRGRFPGRQVYRIPVRRAGGAASRRPATSRSGRPANGRLRRRPPRKQAELAADRSKRMEQEMARLGAAKPAAAHSDAKAFAGYETAVPVKKKTSLGKIILIAVVCLILLIGLLFLIPAPESLQ